jgi:general stress protein YciG
MKENENSGIPALEQPGTPQRKRGFAAMSPESRREVARRGGLASKASGRGNQFTPATASQAARKSAEVQGARERHPSKGYIVKKAPRGLSEGVSEEVAEYPTKGDLMKEIVVDSPTEPDVSRHIT